LVRVRDEIKMTIQAYQTLYESSIAYGMRKALQAEQSKAEKLLQLGSLEKRCMEKENEINDLRKRIMDKLEEEKLEKLRTEEDHERDTQTKKDKNLVQRKQLGEILLSLNKGD
jgi:dynein light intermediate chain, axonemal